LVIDKPVGWHTVANSADASDPAPTIEEWLRRERPELATLDEAGLVHRLDRSTSGCLLVARSNDAQQELRAAISHTGSGIKKVYLALVPTGCAASGSFELHFSGRHRRSAKVTVSERGDARELGRCRWTTIGSTTECDLLEVELLGPGRRHQIRAGLAHLGFPLRGDTLYRGSPPFEGLDGPALHAWRLTVENETIEAPLPDAWHHFHSLVARRTPGSSTINPTTAG